MIDHIVVGAIATNCWIVPISEARVKGEKHGGILKKRQGSCAVVDPGADPDVIIARLERLRLRPRFILLTHGHFDHLGALPDLLRRFQEDGEGDPDIAIHAADADHLGPSALAVHRREFEQVGAAAYVDGLWKDMPRPTRLIADGDRIGPFKVLHLPGHSPGSVAFYDEDSAQLYSGDTLFSGGVGRTDLSGGDGPALDRSLRRLFALETGVAVFPGHGDATTIGKERN